MKKYISLVIALFLLLNVLSPLCAASESGAQLLVELTPTKAVGYVDPSINIKGTIRSVDGESFTYPNSIEVHPKSVTEPSTVDFDISSYSYTYFFAYLGKNADMAAVGRGVQFIVRADGEAIYESAIIRVGDAPVLCIAQIPAGTKTLTLEVNSGDDGLDYDSSTWGTPTLSDKTVTALDEARHPNVTKYAPGEELMLKGAYASVTYGNGFIETLALEESMVSGYDKNVCGTQTLTVSYEGFTYTFKVTVGDIEQTEGVTTDAGQTVTDLTEAPTEAETKAPDDTTSSDPTGLIIIICACAVLLSAAVVVFAVIRRRKK